VKAEDVVSAQEDGWRAMANNSEETMADLAVITVSYAPDFELCREATSSILAYTPDTAKHYIVVPRRDMALFSQLRSPRTEVWPVEKVLPRRVITVPRSNFWINLRRPFPPIRGWVMQQVVKLQMATQVDAELLLFADSDFVFVRPVTIDTFKQDGRVRFYRKEAAIDERLPRHLIWQHLARKVLGAPRAEPPFNDYIHSPGVWERRKVLAMMDRIRQVTGRNWLDVFASQLHVSESTMYGVFVDIVLAEHANVVPVGSMGCHTYWDTSPLSLEAAEKFVQETPDDYIAVWITSKSGTSIEIRRAALAKAGFLPEASSEHPAAR
jgi:hypothetical protein